MGAVPFETAAALGGLLPLATGVAAAPLSAGAVASIGLGCSCVAPTAPCLSLMGSFMGALDIAAAPGVCDAADWSTDAPGLDSEARAGDASAWGGAAACFALSACCLAITLCTVLSVVVIWATGGLDVESLACK